MVTRRALFVTGGLLVAAGCLGGGTGAETTAGGDTGTAATDTESATRTTDGNGDLSVSSPAFAGGAEIPRKYTCDGEDVSPPLRLRGTPDAASLALIVEDPDAPSDDPFVHWTVWNIPTDIGTLPEAIPRDSTADELAGAVQGTNDFGDLGYRGPCPPAGDGPHTYTFTILALNAASDLDPGADPETFRDTLEPQTLDGATITGRYER